MQVATGAFMFLADLVRHIALPVEVDIIRVQSYGNETKTSGVATISTDCKIDLKDKHVIVVCSPFSKFNGSRQLLASVSEREQL